MNPKSPCDVGEELRQKGLGILIKAVKNSNELPTSGTNYVFYNSFPSFQTLMNAQASKILTIMQKCINFQGAKGSVIENLTKRSVDDRFDSLVEINDFLLEKIGANLDDAAGVRTSSALMASSSKKPQQNSKFGRFTIPGVKPSTNGPTEAPEKSRPGVIGRPQCNFKQMPDNSRAAFRPSLKNKPHAVKSLAESLVVAAEGEDDDLQPSPHPYQAELNEFNPSLQDLIPGTEIKKSIPLEETPFMFIKTKHALDEMVEMLKGETEIGVDLEHNSLRSYLGMTCLMQISSWTHDFIIDTLALWDEMQVLNEIFTDPKIMKIFHDGSSDLMWLQRDFGIYVVNMFDTSIAQKFLEARQGVGLITLLNSYCDVSTNKKYQTSDWRRRPLPEEMIKYARIDSHFLPEICRHQRQLFITRERKDQLLVMSDSCRESCLRRYEKPIHTDESYLDVARPEMMRSLNSQQLFAIRALYNWRDEVARLEDESPHYVLPNHMLLMISKTLPREHAGVFACCNPVPLTVRKYIHDIHTHVRDAREVTIGSKIKTIYQAEPQMLLDAHNPPHDLSHREMHEPSAKLDENVELTLVRRLSKESYTPIIRFRAPGGVSGGRSLPDNPLMQYRLSKHDLENETTEAFDEGGTASVPSPPPPIPCTLPPPSPPPPPPPPQEDYKQFRLENKTGKKKKRKRKALQVEASQKKVEEQVAEEEGIETFNYSKAKLPRSSSAPVDRMVNSKTKEVGNVGNSSNTKPAAGGGRPKKKRRK